MLSLDLIRNHTDYVRNGLSRRGEEDAPLDSILVLDAQRRALVQEIDGLRAQRNEVSKEIGELTKGIDPSNVEASDRIASVREEMRQVGDRIQSLQEEASALADQLNELLLMLPNLPIDDVPVGEGETDNVMVREWGERKKFSFSPQPHWDLGEALNILDFQRAVKLSGSRFFILKGMGARLERALISWMLDLHTDEHGYTEIAPPYLVHRDTMVGSGNLPKFADNLYHDLEDDLWLIPTAEVPLTGLHREEILEPETLPLYYVAYSPSFRREKAAAGRDTRGMKRVHQFDKVELYKIVRAGTSSEELESLLSNAEEVCRRLELPYRVVQLCTGDLGFQSAKSYDLEIWAPGVGEWLEVSTCSDCLDFQARRSGIRYRPDKGARLEYPHTLNGSGLALPRLIIAILENYQQEDGSVVVPEVLRSYMGAAVIS